MLAGADQLTDRNHVLELSEMQVDREATSNITAQNATWLTNALAGEGLVALDESRAYVVELPANTSFLSVLGPRKLQPGEGGQCRFVFDPPLAYQGQHAWGVNATPVDTGNPLLVNVSYPNKNFTFRNASKATAVDELLDSGIGDVARVELFSRPLDASVRYRLAAVDGPVLYQGIQGENSGPENRRYALVNRTSPHGCDLSQWTIQTWRRYVLRRG